MSYDENLAGRIRPILSRRRGVTEKKMFGGLAFLLDGRMCCGVIDKDLVVRVGPDRYGAARRQPHTRPMDFTGRPLTGYVYVSPAGCRRDESLAKWTSWGADFVATLPAKTVRAKARGKRRTKR